MEGALAWIGQLAQWFGQFFPRFTTLRATQGAIKEEGFFLPPGLRRFKGELRVTLLGPGLHWWWPATTEFTFWPTAFQTDNLPTQTVETSDGVSVSIGGMISYRVSDAAKLLTNCHSPVMAIRAVTLPAVHQVVCRMGWEELKEAQRRGTLNTKLRNETKKRLSDFGIDVESVELTDMTKVKALRLIQSTQSDTD